MLVTIRAVLRARDVEEVGEMEEMVAGSPEI